MAAKGSHGLLLLAWDDLPQIAQIYTDGLSAKDPPTDCTEFTEAAAGDNLPQISQICTEAANFRGCTCLKCTNQANSDPPTDFTDLHRCC